MPFVMWVLFITIIVLILTFEWKIIPKSCGHRITKFHKRSRETLALATIVVVAITIRGEYKPSTSNYR
jgi:hypothetical protein